MIRFKSENCGLSMIYDHFIKFTYSNKNRPLERGKRTTEVSTFLSGSLRLLSKPRNPQSNKSNPYGKWDVRYAIARSPLDRWLRSDAIIPGQFAYISHCIHKTCLIRSVKRSFGLWEIAVWFFISNNIIEYTCMCTVGKVLRTTTRLKLYFFMLSFRNIEKDLLLWNSLNSP